MSGVPIVIAHRGASGYLPEHTQESKALAHGQGADYLEQDVVATRDGHPIVLHDLHLDFVTDVATCYPDRRRNDGRYYAVDFTLAEIRRLTVCARLREDGQGALYPDRFPSNSGTFRVSTLAEEIELIQGLNRSTGRTAGLYTEIKHPRWHARHGLDLTKRVIEELATFGYRGEEDPIFLQCFDAAELVRAREELGVQLKLVQLVDAGDAEQLSSTDALARVAQYARGLGTPYSCLAAEEGARIVPSRLTHAARSCGLLLHPFTFRREHLPDYAPTLERLLELFLGELEVDGVFCDFPDVAVRVRDAVLGARGTVT